MQRRQFASVLLAAGSLWLAGSAAAAAEKFVYASYISEVYTISKTDLWFMQEVQKRSGGEITFETYFSGSLLKAVDLYPGLQNGAADMVMGAPAAYNRKDYPLSNVLLPYTSDKADAVANALAELYASNADLRKEYEGRNAKLLYILPFAENTVWASKPVGKVADFKGLKIRALTAIADSVQKLGATPVAMAWPDALEGLQRGVVEAMTAAPFDSAVLGGLHEVARYASDGGAMGVYATSATSMSLARYNKLSDKNKKIVDEVAKEAAVFSMKLLSEELDKGVDKLCAYKGNLTIQLFSDEDKQKVRELAATAVHADWAKWATEAAKVDGQAMLAQFVSLVRKHEANSTWMSGFNRYVQRGCGKG